MTLLDLVNRLRIECGISGSDLTSLSGQGRETSRLRNWIIQADLEIQQMFHDWRFLRTDVSFQTVASQSSYAPDASPVSLTDFAEWKPDSFRVYLTSSGVGGETFLGDAMDYDSFRDYWLFNTRRTAYARPIVCSIGPDKKLWLGPGPNDIYTVVGEYYKAPTAMSADSDTTVIPSRFQMVVVYKAMMRYGAHESAPEVYTDGENQYNTMLGSLIVNQGPVMGIGGPLA